MEPEEIVYKPQGSEQGSIGSNLIRLNPDKDTSDIKYEAKLYDDCLR